ncbi:MAG TPA: sulfate/molybdate ABC transporter ATP-binding protein [Verrucomicrobiae bacterium]|nr:sulfate/molybdate ABC transporter ATP-binding protein [Verrucomicrobiae bacterium]
MDLKIASVHKSFANFPALVDVDLDIKSGELVALLGPSGSGKTTLLRVLAGLEFPDYGAILFGGENMAIKPVRERGVGFVFQHYALFKHMTVLDNIGFGLSVRPRADRPGKTQIRKRAQELLDLVQLGELGSRFPHQLSGGQKQRVALARALAIDPRVLLLDEPFGALDAKVRKDLRRWLRELHLKTGTTMVFVTHDQEEALELADRVVIMNRGRIEQIGTTDEVYDHPATPFVFDFLGTPNVFAAHVDGRKVTIDGDPSPIETHSIHPAGAVDVYVRPAELQVVVSEKLGLGATVTDVQRAGPVVRMLATLDDGRRVELELPHASPDAGSYAPKQRIRVRPRQFSVFPRGGVPRIATPSAAHAAESGERSRA